MIPLHANAPTTERNGETIIAIDCCLTNAAYLFYWRSNSGQGLPFYGKTRGKQDLFSLEERHLKCV